MRLPGEQGHLAEETTRLQRLQQHRPAGGAGDQLYPSRLNEIHGVAGTAFIIDHITTLGSLWRQPLSQRIQLDARQIARHRDRVQVGCHEAALSLRQSVAQGMAQGNGKRRMLHQQTIEVRAVENPQIAVDYGPGSDRARLARQECHLAEEITGDEPGQRLATLLVVVREDFNLPRLDEVHGIARVARHIYVITGLDDAGKAPREITPSCAWVLPEGTSIEQLGNVTEHIREKREWLKMAMEAILRIGKLTGSAGELKSRAASGVQVAVERTDLDNEMRMTACQAEEAEREIVRLAVSRYEGRPVPHDELGYSVEYNKKYVLTSVGELVGQLREFVSAGVHAEVPAVTRILLRRLLNALCKRDDAAYRDAMGQIEQAAFARES